MPYVELLHNTPLQVVANAIRVCWGSEERSDTPVGSDILGHKDEDLVRNCITKKHTSVLEHCVYNFLIDGISRACLQELARHRMASLSVKSTRYTLSQLAKEYNVLREVGGDVYPWVQSYLVCAPGQAERRTHHTVVSLSEVLRDVLDKVPTDTAKFGLPECFKTKLAWSINARSMRNFLELRLSKNAMWEIRELAEEVHTLLPESHKFMYEDIKDIK